MGYLVLARKYRPQTFSRIVKQDHIAQTLTHAITSGRVAHAILFSGPRGTGKTTVARILAKAMNCEKGPIAEPCNECRSCKEITASSAVDVFEIDGASNNSVEQIRELRENVKYMPAYSRLKIYIIDEVHMLSTAAFNALLKTLEEPPDHVMFIFATTEAHKIPITILSRCQRHDFRLIDTESIAAHMKMICEKEHVEIADESFWLIAREAGGSMRDALSLLDQVMTRPGTAITHSLVLDMLGIIDRKIVFDFSDAVLQKDIPTILDILEDICSRGYEIRKLYTDIVQHFRNLLIVKMGKHVRKLVVYPEHEIELMRGQVKSVTAAFLNQIFDLLFKEEYVIRMSPHPRLAFEMAFFKLFQIKPALSIDTLIEKLDALGHRVGSADSGKTDPGDTDAALWDKEGQPVEDSRIAAPDTDLDRTWTNLIHILSENNPAFTASLRKCGLKRIDGKSLEIEVADNGFNLNMIRRTKNMSALEKACTAVFGKQMDIILTTKESPAENSQREKATAHNLKQTALSHPLVTTAIEIFDGKLVDVKIL